MKSALLLAAASLAISSAAHAEEGMWTMDAFPTEQMRKIYGWAPDKAWLDRVQAAAVRLTGGCSASFVSDAGLILTNHHCVRSCVQALSTAEQDYIKAGYNPATREEERTCPGQQAEVVTSISDVTPTVKQAIGASTGEALVKARDAVIARLEKEGCTDTATTRCQVVSLFGGGQYKLYKYRKYSDVRLAWAPSEQAAFFGGDPDNFNFPRYAMDAAFLRAYENGKPVSTPAHLTWNPRAPEAGEVTFTVGNPGSTQRLLTETQRAFARDVQYPIVIPLFAELRGRLIAAMEGDPERARTGADLLAGIENSYKAQTGYWGALRNPAFAANLAEQEAELRAKVAADAALKAKVGDPWGAIEEIDEKRRQLYLDYLFLESLGGGFSELYDYAQTIVRAAAEREKPNGERLPGYTDSALPLLEKSLTDAQPIYPWLEELNLAFWLSKTREYLKTDTPAVQRLLGKESPEGLAERLVEGTRLADPAVRKALFEGGMAAVKASKDPLIQFVLKADADARAVRRKWEAEVTGPTAVANAKLADARFGVYGDTLYPDATFTLRISYGSVKGWDERGTPVPPTTKFAGLYERATGAVPYDLPSEFAAAKGKIDMATVYNFVTTNDIIGGNSGSPVIARDGSVIGAAFDGNIHMLGGNFGYDPVLNRTVVVSTAAVQEALEVVYPNQRLMRELAAK
ncbi:S46 family peptidase [Sphingomonas gilva]|uniref:S46 family peptidase n=1 Tax=Sphingomonas gilva TaxID=2305907 RepID=UPI001FECC8E8|nr:S46 family peptidase [Sphingomonas gilva]